MFLGWELQGNFDKVTVFKLFAMLRAAAPETSIYRKHHRHTVIVARRRGTGGRHLEETPPARSASGAPLRHQRSRGIRGKHHWHAALVPLRYRREAFIGKAIGRAVPLAGRRGIGEKHLQEAPPARTQRYLYWCAAAAPERGI